MTPDSVPFPNASSTFVTFDLVGIARQLGGFDNGHFAGRYARNAIGENSLRA